MFYRQTLKLLALLFTIVDPVSVMADLNRPLGNRALVIVSILLFNALSWYYMTLTLASKAYPLSDQLWIVYYFAIILASIVGSLAAHRIEDRKSVV